MQAKDAIAFAAVWMKEAYYSRHSPMFFKVDDIADLRLHRGYSIPGIQNKKIEQAESLSE